MLLALVSTLKADSSFIFILKVNIIIYLKLHAHGRINGKNVLKAVCPIRTKRFWFRLLPLLIIACLITTGQAGTVVAESGNALTASGSAICGTKFGDVNGNGVQDANESGLPGWTIQLLDAAGNVVDTATTGTGNAAGPAGRFCFNNVPAGSYTVREVSQAGWVQTFPTAPGTHSVTVGAGTAPSTLLFGNMLSSSTTVGSSICGSKFNDVNGNGVQDAGEPGLPGWTIQLIDAAGNVIATTITSPTDAAGRTGRFCFNNVSAGSYTVREVAQPGWQQTVPIAPGTYNVTVGAGTAPSTLLFGNTQGPGTGVVCATKFEDKNGNGVQDPGELGLSGWSIQLWFDGAPQQVSTAVTGKDGSVCFSVGYPAGGLPYVYHVAEVMKPGWQQTLPGGNGSYTVQVSAAQPQAPMSFFGNMQVSAASTVCGIKFEDKNGNGVQDPDELGLSGWTIQETDATGHVLATVVTDKNGKYCFTGLPRGTYTFAEVMQPGWQQTFPHAPGTHTVTVDGSQSVESIDFGNMQSSGAGSVCGTKFEDKNGNGVQDPGELGLGGWTIQVTDAAGHVVSTVATDKNGAFCFKDLHLSVYTVSEVMQPGWQQTLPGTGSYTVQLTAAQHESKPLLFGNMQSSEAGSVCGIKFEDKNGNGVQDSGEFGLGGWTIQVLDDKGNVVATVVTRDNGRFCFERLRPGKYTFTEVMQPGWQQTLPGGTGTYTVQLTATQLESKPLLFGNMQPAGAGRVCGTKFEDKNGNGVQDSGELGLSDWTIQVLDDKGNVVTTVVTGKDGTFCFERLRPGLYTVSELMKPGWQQTLPGGSGSYSVQLTAGQLDSKPLLFGNMQSDGTGTICGIKFEDKNGNGKQDSGEVGLGGWTIQVKDASGHVVATVVTRDDGTYCLKDLRPGVYTFAEVMQPGYQQTFPGAPFTHTVKVVGGQNAQSVDFGNQKKPDPCCVSLRFQQGVADNFATANGTESAQPSAALVQAMPAGASYSGLDGTVSDRFVAHTFSLPAGNCVQSASLEFKVKPLDGNSDNDSVSLRFAGVPGTPTWGAYLGATPPNTSLVANAWYLPNYSAGQVFSLDLASLPGGGNLIPTLNAQRFLDFVVQDDTSVDYVLLTVKFCECAGSSTGPRVDTDEPVADNGDERPRPAAKTGVSIRLVLDSKEATVNGEAVRLPTPAVLRDGSTMVPLRWIGEALGAEVQWDPAERRATYVLGDLKVELWIDKLMARANGKDVSLSSAPTLIGGSTFVPLRFIGEAFGLTVKFNPDDRSISIFDRWGNL